MADNERLLKGPGGFGSILELAHNWADFGATRRHYELMARYVHPHFQGSREWRQESYVYAGDHHHQFLGQSAAAVQAEIHRLPPRRAKAREPPLHDLPPPPPGMTQKGFAPIGRQPVRPPRIIP